MIRIIGMGDDGLASLPSFYWDMIQEADILVGGERQLAMIPPTRAERVVLKSGIKAAIESLLPRKEEKIVVLASGDPLFYGVGGLVAKAAGKENVEVYPFFSSIQLAFSRIKEPWQDARLFSLHGRSIKGFAQQVDGVKKAAILTDEENSPDRIARYLLDFGIKEYEAFVLEHLGGEKERMIHGSLPDIAEQRFAPLNVMILLCNGKPPHVPLGIPDDWFAQRKPDRGLITKREVRVVSLSSLALREDSIVWDIGAGTGSVGIEAARIARRGAVFAIEKNEADVKNIFENMKRFRADLTVVHGKAPAGLDQWPDPDAVFIGGSGGELRELIAMLAERLRPGGRIVVNAATIENLYAAYAGLKEEGFTVEITQVQTSRSKPILEMTRLEAHNPVFVLTAFRGGDESHRQ
jgi:precorrin-6Y C5,15-methyltransferase (decarboxylating)